MSRYPAMSQAPAAYDRSLLVGAPAITRQDRQAGYDVNALERGAYNQQTTTAAPPAALVPPPAPARAGSDPFQDGYYDGTFSPAEQPIRKPWWKRKRWIALALIIFVGILCGIIAGAVAARNSVNSARFNDAQNAASEPAAATSSSLSSSSPLLQSPTTIINAPATQNTVVSPANPTQPIGGGNGATTIAFGTSTTRTRTSGGGAGALPTATANDPFDDPFNGEIPLICYTIPQSPSCAPYFDDPPRA